MQVIILAAGMGNRLQPFTRDVPKAMVRVNGKEIILHQLDSISRLSSVSEIIIVVGYYKQCIKNLLGDSFHGAKITYIDNDEYASTNNVFSLHLAMPHVREDVLLLEGDVIFRPELLERIACSPDTNLILVEKYQRYMDGCVVEIDERTQRVLQLIPKRNQGDHFDYSHVYKTVNIYHFTHNFFVNTYRPALEWHIATYGRKDYYELIIGALLYMNACDLRAEVLEERKMLWFEIDDLVDLRIAELHFSDDATERFQKKFGGYWDFDILDYCYLSNPFFPPSRLVHEIAERAADLIGSYPSGSEHIRYLMSSLFSSPVSLEYLFVGNGASEFIRILTSHVYDSFTIPTPTFDEYLAFHGQHKVIPFPLLERDEFQCDVDALISTARKTNHLILINPNNPTGAVLDRDAVRRLLRELRTLKSVTLDESFIDFSDTPSCVDMIDEFPNLVVLKSISKSYGVPGLRLGYLYTRNTAVLHALRRHLPIWNIGAFAERFLERFSKYRSEYQQSLVSIKEERLRVTNAISSIGCVRVFPSHGNFLLCKIERENIGARALTNALLRTHRILIKDLSHKMNGNFIRLAIRNPDENQRLVACLTDTLDSLDTLRAHPQRREPAASHALTTP